MRGLERDRRNNFEALVCANTYLREEILRVYPRGAKFPFSKKRSYEYNIERCANCWDDMIILISQVIGER